MRPQLRHSCQTNRARCALYKKVLDLLNEESISGESSGRASLLIRREVLLQKFEQVSLSLSTIHFLVHKHIYRYIYIYIREYGSTLYVGLARAVSPTNTNFRLTFLLTRLQEALYEDLAVLEHQI